MLFCIELERKKRVRFSQRIQNFVHSSFSPGTCSSYSGILKRIVKSEVENNWIFGEKSSESSLLQPIKYLEEVFYENARPDPCER